MPNLNTDILITNINNLMKSKGITQSKLSQEINITQPCISKYLSGKATISLDFLYNVAEQLGVTMDYLCTDHTVTDSSDPQPTPEPRYISQIQGVCTGLAEIFKSGYLYSKEFDFQEVVYAELRDEDGYYTSMYHRKKDPLTNMDPSNKYHAIFFPNYLPIETAFASPDEADEYFMELDCCGNLYEPNVTVNRFLKQLIDLYTIYKNGSMPEESYLHAIDSNLAKVLHL